MIDIKELRVGSHVVSIGGRRIRITSVDELNGNIGIDSYKTDERGVKYPICYPLEQVEPIPITDELLEELGFVKVERRVYCRPKTEYIDAETATRKRGMYEYFPPKISVFGGNPTWCVSARNCDGYDCKTFCRNLHELENFVYLVRKEEIEKLNGNDIQQ